MDDRDRNHSSGSPGRYSRRRPPDESGADERPVRRRPRTEDEVDAVLTRGDDRRIRGDRDRILRSDDPITRSEREPGRYRPAPREDGDSRSWSADRFRRSGKEREADPDDRSPSSTRDPYDRLRRVGNRPARRVEVDPYEESGHDDLDETNHDEVLAATGRARARQAHARAATPGLRQQQIRSVGALVANPSAELRPIVLGSLIAAGSLFLLSVLLLLRGGELPAWFPTRWNAEGEPTVFGTSATAWRLPVFAFFTSVIALGLGWWLRVREPFATQFLSVGMLLIHGLVWISVITLLW